MAPIDQSGLDMNVSYVPSDIPSYSTDSNIIIQQNTDPLGFGRNVDNNIDAEDDDELDADEDEQDEESSNSQEEELINKLMNDKISFSEVTAMFDVEGDSDVEEASPNNSQETVIDSAAAFDKEFLHHKKLQLKRKRLGEKRRQRKLPSALAGLMGEASLRFAQQNYDEAIKMCLEVIRQYSCSPDPYYLLGMVYEEKKMKTKSLQFRLISAFLSSDAAIWEELANVCVTQNDLRQAVFCLTRAIKANPLNLENHYWRCNLLESLDDKARMLKAYSHLLKYMGDNKGKDALKLAKDIATIHYGNNDLHLAREAMETAFKKYPAFATPADINLMMEVLIAQKQYLRCIEIFISHGKVKLFSKDDAEITNIKNQLHEAIRCTLPKGMPIDLRTKLTVAFIHMDVIDIASSLVVILEKESKDDFGDLYIDVAEAYMTVKKHTFAMPLLRSLLETEQYNQAAVWLQYAECLAAMKLMDKAADAYSKVVQLAPQHAEARLTLSSIMQSLGQLDDALLILNQGSDSGPHDTQVLYQRCKMLLEQDLLDDFINAAKLLFRKHFVHIRNKDEADVMLNNKKLSNKHEALRELRRSKNEPLEDSGPEFTGTDISIEQQWELFLKLCHILHEKGRFEELERVTFSAIGSKEFMRDKDRSKEVEFMCLLACISNNSSYFAFNIMRELVMKNPENTRCWNLLNLIISKADDFRHNRFLLRLTHKHTDSVPLGILNGHNCLVAGTYKYSLAEYTQALKQEPKNPLVALMLGLTYTHMACQKFSGKKHSLVVQSSAFLSAYEELRGECQESLYNLGRASHQLNLLPQAIHYYKKALACPPIVKGNEIYDLKQEIAFNLALIYKNSGSVNLAKMYLFKYIDI